MVTLLVSIIIGLGIYYAWFYFHIRSTELTIELYKKSKLVLALYVLGYATFFWHIDCIISAYRYYVKHEPFEDI